MSKFKIRFFYLQFYILILCACGTILWSGLDMRKEIQKSPLDERVYLAETLENGLPVIVVSDAKAHTCAAALVVAAGSFNDPKELTGLAHFLEHMLFLGTKKFPQSDEFKQFLTTHGGNYNGMTQGEETLYYFSIPPDHFVPALERFSDFFISPLFNQALMERELNAVDSEFHLNINQENYRSLEVNKETSNPQHPFSQFMIGNLTTLSGDKDKLYAQVIQFYKTHYQANKMTLAIVGPQSAQELMAFANQYFSKITSAHSAKVHRSSLVFDKAQEGLDILMKSKTESRSLSFTFPFPRDEGHLKQKPAMILAVLLTHESPGKLIHTLKKKQWIDSASGNYDAFSNEQGGLTINFALTKEGEAHIDDITQYFFSYLELIKQKGVPAYFIDELKAMNHKNFLYAPRQEPSDMAMTLAHRLQKTSPHNLLIDGILLPNDSISKAELAEIMALITPHKMRRFFHHQQVEGKKHSTWYDVNYTVIPLSKKQIAIFSNPAYLSLFSLPEKNRFIPKSLSLEKQRKDNPVFPSKIALGGVTLWHYQDKLFKRPTANILINFISPFAFETPENNLLATLYATLVIEKLREQFYSAALAGATIYFYPHHRGITLSMSGYNDKQDNLLSEILKTVHSIKLDPTLFKQKLHLMIKDLSNFEHAPLATKAFSELGVLLFSPAWGAQEILLACQRIQFDDLTSFWQQFWQTTHIEVLIHGNYSEKKAKHLGNIIIQEFQPQKYYFPEKYFTKVVKLPENSTIHRNVKTLDENHIIAWYRQNPTADYPTIAKTLLLRKILEGPFFQSLRTEQQLGYALNVNSYLLNKTSGLLFWLQSPNVAPQALLSKIQLFLTSQYKTIHELNEEKISPFRQGLIHQFQQPPQSLGEQTGRWWGQIENGEGDFEYDEKIVRELEKITANELTAFADQLLYATPHAGEVMVFSSSCMPQLKDKEITFIQAFKANSDFFVKNPSQSS